MRHLSALGPALALGCLSGVGLRMRARVVSARSGGGCHCAGRGCPRMFSTGLERTVSCYIPLVVRMLVGGCMCAAASAHAGALCPCVRSEFDLMLFEALS